MAISDCCNQLRRGQRRVSDDDRSCSSPIVAVSDMMARLHSWVANDTAKSLGGNVTTKVVQKPLASREPQTQQVCARTSSPILCLSLITSRKNVFRTHIFKTTNSDLKPENKIQIGFDFILIKYTTGTLGAKEFYLKNPTPTLAGGYSEAHHG